MSFMTRTNFREKPNSGGRIMRAYSLVLSGIVLGLFSAQSPAATVGLWLFDSLSDATPPAGGPPPIDPLGGETLLDSSGNNLNFVASTNSGTVALTSDRPTVMGGGTQAFDSDGGGFAGFSTPSTALLHRGTTGALSIEFWFKSVSITPSVAGILSFPGGNGNSTFVGDWGIYQTSAGDLKFYEYSQLYTNELNTGTTVSDGNWHHVAFTVDATGARRGYLDGALVSQLNPANTASPALADVLKFGRADGDGFANTHIIMDELRISDVALLPGSGSGAGELAWNASLVLEPAALASLAIPGAIGLVRRRRK
jgi:hypothetical protein